MCRHAVTSGSVAQFAEPVPKTRRGVRLAEMGHQKSFDPDRRRRIDDLAQFGMYWYFKVRFLAAFGLALIDSECIAVNMLAAELNNITAPLAGVQQQGEGKASFSADRM